MAYGQDNGNQSSGQRSTAIAKGWVSIELQPDGKITVRAKYYSSPQDQKALGADAGFAVLVTRGSASKTAAQFAAELAEALANKGGIK